MLYRLLLWYQWQVKITKTTLAQQRRIYTEKQVTTVSGRVHVGYICISQHSHEGISKDLGLEPLPAFQSARCTSFWQNLSGIQLGIYVYSLSSLIPSLPPIFSLSFLSHSCLINTGLCLLVVFSQSSLFYFVLFALLCTCMPWSPTPPAFLPPLSIHPHPHTSVSHTPVYLFSFESPNKWNVLHYLLLFMAEFSVLWLEKTECRILRFCLA